MTNKLDIKISSKDFRVPPGKKVDLSQWPTVVESFTKSKKEYKQLLQQHKKAEFSAKPSLRIPQVCAAPSFSGHGWRRKRWGNPSRHVGRQS